MFVYYSFIGTDCKTERVGIIIRELIFNQCYTDQESAEFKGLESSLLSAVRPLVILNMHLMTGIISICLEGSGVNTLDLWVKLNQNGDI